LTVTVAGELARNGKIALSELARIAGELQSSLERLAVAAGSAAGEQRAGRRRADLVEAVRLDLTSFTGGSAVLELAPHAPEQQQLFRKTTALDGAYQALVRGVAALVDDPYSMPPGFNHAILTGLVDLTSSIGAGVSEVRIERPGMPALILDGQIRNATRTARRRYLDEVRTIIGRLEMGDFAPSALRCRIDTADKSYTCDFDPPLREAVLSAMDQIVEAVGAAETSPETGNVRILHLDHVTVVPEQRTARLEELIAQQAIRPIQSARELIGVPIDDFDQFMGEIRSLRETMS
jgi:hypothetical protein